MDEEPQSEPEDVSGDPEPREGEPEGNGGAAGPDEGAAGATEELAAAARGGDPMAPEESERLAREIREELEEMEELHDRHLRLAAEFENYRKRTRRELQQARERAQAELAERLLDALDDLDRVLETPAESTTAESLHEGVEMVARKLEKELGEAGLSRIEAEGRPFDPEVHEALITTPVDDPEENNVVSRVLINGYAFGDRVIRPARVEVQKYTAGSSGNGEDGDGENGGG